MAGRGACLQAHAFRGACVWAAVRVHVCLPGPLGISMSTGAEGVWEACGDMRAQGGHVSLGTIVCLDLNPDLCKPRWMWERGACRVRVCLPLCPRVPTHMSAPQELPGQGGGLTGGWCWWEKVISKGSARPVTFI